MHEYVQTYMSTHEQRANTCIQTQLNTLTQVHTQTCAHLHLHNTLSYTYTLMNTYTQSHTHTHLVTLTRSTQAGKIVLGASQPHFINKKAEL